MGSVFKLVFTDEYFYIGSTTKTLEEALKMIRFKNHFNTTHAIYQHIFSDWDAVKIELIEKVDTDLRKKTNEYWEKEIDNPKCVNDKRKGKKEDKPVLTEEQMAKNKATAEKRKATIDRKKAEKDAYEKGLMEQRRMEAIQEGVWKARYEKEEAEKQALSYEARAKGHRTEALTQKKAYNIKEAEYWEDRAKTKRQTAEHNLKDAEARYDEWRKAQLTANLTEA
jgi:hypothetical protein